MKGQRLNMENKSLDWIILSVLIILMCALELYVVLYWDPI